MFASTLEYLRAELQWLDLLLHREILRLRACYQLSLDEFRGLYVSDEHVDALVARVRGEAGLEDAVALTRRALSLRAGTRRSRPSRLPWDRVAREFRLCEIEQDILLLAMAPEVHLKYETLYAYLHNDVTRKTPTCDLAARVLASSPAEALEVRRALMPEGTLFHDGLLAAYQPEQRTKLLGLEFGVAPAAARYLLDLDRDEPPPSRTWDELPLPAPIVESLQRLSVESPPVVLETEDGLLARAVAEAACRKLAIPLAAIDLSCDERLQQRLRRRGLYLDAADAFWQHDSSPAPEARRFLQQISKLRGPLFIHFVPEDSWRPLFKGIRALSFTLPQPEYTGRGDLWRHALVRRGETITEDAIDSLASRFALTASSIEASIAAASDRRNVEQPGMPLDLSRLTEAARLQSGQALGRLARKIPLGDRWDDLVLPAATLAQLKELASAARHRYLIYSVWGMGKRSASGDGVKALFSGASGTGKTMSAGVIAGELGLDLYQIDLSGVVSKYIGETEKNLDRIFRAARGSNAILFFDEADALFGKRSEVKDAHDRYANIEIAYLLQKMEEYDGIAILASNLSSNIDEAFSRRLQYVIEFPLPDEAMRLRLWRKMFPPEAPLARDVDLDFLARQFRLAGGDIRNVVLAAAFLAADNGRVITMELLAKAMARQMIKQGRVPSSADFKQYYPLLGART